MINDKLLDVRRRAEVVGNDDRGCRKNKIKYKVENVHNSKLPREINTPVSHQHLQWVCSYIGRRYSQMHGCSR